MFILDRGHTRRDHRVISKQPVGLRASARGKWGSSQNFHEFEEFV